MDQRARAGPEGHNQLYHNLEVTEFFLEHALSWDPPKCLSLEYLHSYGTITSSQAGKVRHEVV